MKTKKMLTANVVSASLVILAYKLSPWGKMLINVAPGIRSIVSTLIEIILYSVLYFILILALEKNKCLFSKPLFNSSDNFAKNTGITKIVILVLLQFVRYIIPKFFYPVVVLFGGAGAPTFRLIVSLVHWTIVYFIIVGKKDNIFTIKKYAGATVAIVIFAYVISTVVAIVGGHILAENAFSASGKITNIFDALSAIDNSKYNLYINVMNAFDTIAEVITVGALIVFHKLSLNYLFDPQK